MTGVASPSPGRRALLVQLVAMLRTGRHPDMRQVGPTLRRRLPMMIAAARSDAAAYHASSQRGAS